jgi:hypothetical protein
MSHCPTASEEPESLRSGPEPTRPGALRYGVERLATSRHAMKRAIILAGLVSPDASLGPNLPASPCSVPLCRLPVTL